MKLIKINDVYAFQIADIYILAMRQGPCLYHDLVKYQTATPKDLEKEAKLFEASAQKRCGGYLTFPTDEEAKEAFDKMVSEFADETDERSTLFNIASDLIEGVEPWYAAELRDQYGVSESLADRLGLPEGDEEEED